LHRCRGRHRVESLGQDIQPIENHAWGDHDPDCISDREAEQHSHDTDPDG
jgi:hypothetical protein